MSAAFTNPLLNHRNSPPPAFRDMYRPLEPSHKVIKQKPQAPVKETYGKIPSDKTPTERTYRVEGHDVKVRPNSFLPMDLRAKVTKLPDIHAKRV